MRSLIRSAAQSTARLGLLALAIVLLSGVSVLRVQAQTPPAPAAPAQTPAATPQSPQTTPPADPPLTERNAAAVDPNTYTIGPEDVIRVHVWKEAELTTAVTVRPDGRITLPLIGEVVASGQTPMALQKQVAEALGKDFLTRPQVSISVLEVRSKKYYVTGKIGRSGAVPLIMPTTVLQALSAAGPMQEFAKTNKIIIMRGEQRIKFNYKEVIKGKNLKQNILLENGDHIVVP